MGKAVVVKGQYVGVEVGLEVARVHDKIGAVKQQVPAKIVVFHALLAHLHINVLVEVGDFVDDAAVQLEGAG